MKRAVERHIEVPRTARYWVLGEGSTGPREVWFVLHGYGQLAQRFLSRFSPLDDGTRLIVAPEALSRFYATSEPGRHGPASVVGATWMTREDRLREIDDYVRYLDRLAADVLDALDERPPVTVLGFSQGVATAARWCALGRMRPARLALWGEFLPPDLDLARARDAWAAAEVVLVRGTRDGVFADEARAAAEEEAVRAAGLPLKRVSYEGGHVIDPRALAALAWSSAADSAT